MKLELPWKSANVKSNLKKGSQKITGKIVEIKTRTNEVITILPEGKNFVEWSVISEMLVANENVKYHSSGKTRLGIPRMY